MMEQDKDRRPGGLSSLRDGACEQSPPKASIPDAEARRSLSAWAERRPSRTAAERAVIARFFAEHLPEAPCTVRIADEDIDALRAAHIRRFDEDLPRTETLFAVAMIGYRMALRDTDGNRNGENGEAG